MNPAHELPTVANLTTLVVYGLWRKYSQDCSNSDQSAILGEFIEWYREKLGGNRDALQAAIQSA